MDYIFGFVWYGFNVLVLRKKHVILNRAVKKLLFEIYISWLIYEQDGLEKPDFVKQPSKLLFLFKVPL